MSNAVQVDIHSHLLPGLDDGVKTFEESASIIQRFVNLGYRKLITTPHVISDTYRNTTEGILQKRDDLIDFLKAENINIELEAAAEYYLDEELFKNLQEGNPLLTFGNNFLLFETNFITEPFILKEFIFTAATKGYKLVLAHPERYAYLQLDEAKMEDLINRGVYFQINLTSLTGYYSRESQRAAQKLIDKGWVHFLGSDCHAAQHISLIETIKSNRYFQKALTLPLLNNAL
ncbi:MAG: capsular biosynthesis protein [Cyclobacteriaceae bacterium]|nr:capsular biosynthesis protein [Cyclobacteriaceae bacterium]